MLRQRSKRDEVKQLFVEFLKDYVTIVKQSVMKIGDRMFHPSDIFDDDYVYNVDIKVKNSVTYLQIRRSELVVDAKDKVYGLHVIREIENGAYLGLYMGELFDFDRNEKEEHQCGKLRVERYNPYISMHYIDNPMYHVYEKA